MAFGLGSTSQKLKVVCFFKPDGHVGKWLYQLRESTEVGHHSSASPPSPFPALKKAKYPFSAV